MTLRLAAATYRYAGAARPSLHEIDLELAPGDLIGVVGPNDAGKSTLCLVAAGLAPATIQGELSGSVTIDALDTRSARPHELAQRAGILFQNPVTQLSGTSATVWEEIAFGPRNLGLALSEVIERVDEAADRLAIADLCARDPERLSGGQAQLVALASILAMRPAYLLLDEPTSQLDPQGTRLVGQALAGLAAGGETGILIVEHKTDLLDRLCASVLVIEQGRIARRGGAAEILADPGLPAAGVEPPARVRLMVAARAAGVDLDPGPA
jgi:energy-coupling factor transport system ATP-binding protein